MPVTYPSQYIFDRGNINYIEAIAVYNKNLLVTAVNDEQLDTPFPCSQLLNYIRQSDVQRFQIDCISQDESSTIDVFPKIEGIDILAFLGIEEEKVDAILDSVKGELEKIRMSLDLELNRTSQTRRPSIAPIQNITKEQALLFLYQLNKEFTLTGSVLFEQCNTIIFQHHGKNHLLRYGDRSNYLHYISHIRFDIEDGFFTEEDPMIKTELQKLFWIWFKNDHVGPVIPKEYSGFHPKPTCEKLSHQKLTERKQQIEESNFSRGVQPDLTTFPIDYLLRFAFFSSLKLTNTDTPTQDCHTLV